MLNKLLTIFLLTNIQMTESTFDYDQIHEDCRVWLNCNVTVYNITREQYQNNTDYLSKIKIYDTPIFEGRTSLTHNYCHVSINMKSPIEKNDTFPIQSINLTQFNIFFDNIGGNDCYDGTSFTIFQDLNVFNNHTAIDIYFYPLIVMPEAKIILMNIFVDFLFLMIIFYIMSLFLQLVYVVFVKPFFEIILYLFYLCFGNWRHYQIYGERFI